MKKLLVTSVLLASVTSVALADDCANNDAKNEIHSTADVPVNIQNGLLTGPHGMTLYTFDKDVANSGKSVCNDKCAEYWPPLFAHDDSKASGDYTVITRDYGTKQWAFKGKPLYYWVKDKKVGDTTGDGVHNVWRVAKP